MHIANRLLLLASIFFVAAGTAFSQDEDLIDDLPKETKEAAAKKASQRPRDKGSERKQPSSGTSPKPSLPGGEAEPPLPNTDLIDDLSPEQKQAAKPGALAKKAGDIPENLAEALAQALHNNPNILVAEAKVQQAQAELNEVRQKVVHDLTAAYGRLLVNKGGVPAEKMFEARLAVREDEAKVLYLLGAGTHDRPAADISSGGKAADHTGQMGPAGMSGMMGPTGMSGMMMGGPMGMGAMMRGRLHELTPTERATEAATELDPGLSNLPEKVRRFLETRVDMDFETQPLKDVLDYMKEAGKADVNFVLLYPEDWQPPEEMKEGEDERLYRPVTLHLQRVTIAAALQALVDLHGCAFVFRDYGILVLGPDQGLSGGGNAAGLIDSYRAAGTPMIAPPPQVPMGAAFMGPMRMGGAGMGGMPGMGGPSGMSAGPSPSAPAEK